MGGHTYSLSIFNILMSATSKALICESHKMVKIDDLPIWIVPFLTSLYFEENHKDGDHCVCTSRKLCQFRPYFCIQCEKGHLCKKVFKAGKRHYNHEKLQVCKVTGRNSIHIQDIIAVLDKDIVADVRDYKYNHEVAFSLLGNGMTQNRTLQQAEHKLNREVCKWCGRSTRALHQERKTLCSLGCALESVFHMTLQEIHEAQLRLHATDAPRVRPQESQITTTTKDMNDDETKDMNDNETKVIECEHHRIVPNNVEILRHTSHRFGNAYDGDKGKVKEEDINVISQMVNHKDGNLQGDSVNGSLQSPLSKLNKKKRTRKDLGKCSKTYNPQLTFEDTKVEPSSIQACSTSEATTKLDNPNEIKRTPQRGNKGKKQREIEARNYIQKLGRITKAPQSVSRKVSIDLDMFHNLCLLAYGDIHMDEAEEENVGQDAPSS